MRRRSSTVTTTNIDELRAILAERKRALAAIPKRVKQLLQQIAEVERELGDVDATADEAEPRRREKAAPDSARSSATAVGDLGDLLARILAVSKAPKSIADLATVALAAGYDPKGARLDKSIEAALAGDGQRFVPAGPGRYRLRTTPTGWSQ